MTAESEMPIVLPLFLGCEILAKMIPRVIESMKRPTMVCTVMSKAPQ